MKEHTVFPTPDFFKHMYYFLYGRARMCVVRVVCLVPLRESPWQLTDIQDFEFWSYESPLFKLHSK